MEYLKIANSSIVYAMGLIVIVVVFSICVYFLIKSWKHAREIGIERETLINVVKGSAIFSIVPSLPIVISLIAMAPILGIPFPWIRLSIIGSAPYELISAEIGAKSMGISGLGGQGYTSEVFANSMWVMSFGIIWGLVICIFGLKKIQGYLKKSMMKNSQWGSIFICALFFGMLSVFLSEPLVKGGVSLFTLISGGLIMAILTGIEKKLKVRWLGNFSLSISMIFAMIMAVLYTKIIL